MPPEFGLFGQPEYATILYQSMGGPAINSENVWSIYHKLRVLHRFEHLDSDAVNFMEECQVYFNVLDDQINLDLDDEAILNGCHHC